MFTGWLAPAVFAAVLCTGLALLLSRLEVSTNPESLVSRVNDIARTVASALFLTAGVLRLTRWRVNGDARSAVMGSALILLGALGFPLVTVAGLLAGGADDAVVAGLTRAVVAVLVIDLVWRALTIDDGADDGADDAADEDRTRPVRLITRRAAIALGGFMLLVGLSVAGVTRLLVPLPVELAVPALLSAGWIAVGLRATLLADQHAWAGRVAPLLGAMGVAELMRPFDNGADGTWTLAALALDVAVATITMVSALLDLNEAAELRSAQTNGLVHALERASGVASNQRAWREEMAHDATNALTALRGALLTLQRYDGRLDEGTVGRLRSAAIDEVHHLEHLILSTEHEPVQAFDAWDTVRSVTAARQATGLDVNLAGQSAPALGRPADVATALANLLVNAAVHAPGSPVTVDVANERHRVLITVSDDGPGLTAAEAVRIFGRGTRGPGSPGSGLGLHVARTVMRSQGGDVELRSRDGGATFVISIPSAPTDRQPAAPALMGSSL